MTLNNKISNSNLSNGNKPILCVDGIVFASALSEFVNDGQKTGFSHVAGAPPYREAR